MALIEWKPEFSVGNERLDQDHRRLIDIINELGASWDDGTELRQLRAIMDRLVAYTVYHFDREERILEEMDYDRLENQQTEHAMLRNMLTDFSGRYLSGEEVPEFTAEMRDFLQIWLMDHILDEDLRYRPLFA